MEAAGIENAAAASKSLPFQVPRPVLAGVRLATQPGAARSATTTFLKVLLYHGSDPSSATTVDA